MWAFATDLIAIQTALLVSHDRKTVNRHYGLFRAAIHAHQIRQRTNIMWACSPAVV
jgi:hypothetical protein